MIRDITLRVSPKVSATPERLVKEIANKAGITVSEVNDFRIVRRSIDARQKNVMVNLNVRVAIDDDKTVMPLGQPKTFTRLPKNADSIIIVGAGPAGLFAALKAIEFGLRPIVLERGHDVDTRRVELASISRDKVINPDSNYCFGEGGAGAYSDGKLFTRSKKRGNVEEILQLLHQHGASSDILIDAHPHIGSDKLPEVIKNIRNTILEAGGEVKFSTKVVEILLDGKKAVGVKTKDGECFYGPVVLATGHSARDVYRMLHNQGIKMEAKGLAMGVRLEHPQNLIDCLQYHSPQGRGSYLPAAEYSYVTQVDGRGVYSFCMCPGGVIVPAMSDNGQSVVNGMSASARASQWANSGMVVEVHPGDVPGYSDKGELEMMYLQESLETKFFEASDNSINAPAQRMIDFTMGKTSETLPRSSYPAGIHSARLDMLLPKEISSRLKEGFKIFDKKNRGFLTNEAILVGLESRTSSPVRIPRDKDSLQHLEIENLFPAGEGAGYAGGIVSAAIDGQRCVEAYIKSIKSNGNNN
ncbi:MAG: NAD(P)/FAD-dependent oxidoreductase [Muribaculaceae bacterium]|nr:NAD(P)/FAD-dependent oxidoreductase [Muribaculaceae bacterium]